MRIEWKERYGRQLVLECLWRVLLQREQRKGAVADQRQVSGDWSRVLSADCKTTTRKGGKSLKPMTRQVKVEKRTQVKNEAKVKG